MHSALGFRSAPIPSGTGTRHRRLPRPGIPPSMREAVFKPFLRLDDARNQDEGGSGLGLAIARSLGGDITLGDSQGGLPAAVRVPV